jgi:hypothetical protein
MSRVKDREEYGSGYRRIGFRFEKSRVQVRDE